MREQRQQGRQIRRSLIGLAGTVGVHALLMLPVVLTLSQPARPHPNRSGPGATAVDSGAAVMTVVFINEPSHEATPPTVDPQDLTSKGFQPKDLTLVVLSPDPVPASDAQPDSSGSATSQQTPGDPAQHAMLYGRYLGQVQARIDRAWLRPRADIGSEHFTCRAAIHQDRTGTVVGVTLDRCNGTPRWQQSLVSAIHTASPLPAPPDPSVYADVLSLVFESRSIESGEPEDEFEPARRVLADATPVTAPASPRSLGERTGFLERPSDSDNNTIDLTIVRDSSSVTTHP